MNYETLFASPLQPRVDARTEMSKERRDPAREKACALVTLNAEYAWHLNTGRRRSRDHHYRSTHINKPIAEKHANVAEHIKAKSKQPREKAHLLLFS